MGGLTSGDRQEDKSLVSRQAKYHRMIIRPLLVLTISSDPAMIATCQTCASIMHASRAVLGVAQANSESVHLPGGLGAA